MVPLKAGDATTAFRKLFNFLIKRQNIEVDDHYNPLDTPEIICTVLSKLPLNFKIDGIATHCSFEENIKRNFS